MRMSSWAAVGSANAFCGGPGVTRPRRAVDSALKVTVASGQRCTHGLITRDAACCVSTYRRKSRPLDEHSLIIGTTLALLNFPLSIQECAHADANRLKHAVYVPHR